MNTLLIATIRSENEIRNLVNEIKSTASTDLKLIISSSNNSVAINVNRGLDESVGQFIIKVDDDITGFTHGWDAKLIQPFSQIEDLEVISARLLNMDGSIQLTCSRDSNLHGNLSFPRNPIVPFCCVAFKRSSLRMDENFIGSGYDDADYCCQLRLKNADARFAINNEVRLIHKHEQKNSQLSQNALYFRSKWKDTVFSDGKGAVE
jgi:hypothetical protein